MKHFTLMGSVRATVVALLTLSLALPRIASAESPVKMKKWSGTIDFSTEGPTLFTLQGTASHLGKFTAYGEVNFEPGETDDSLIGEGVAVFVAANGDLLVGDVTWHVDAGGGDFRTSQIAFHWADSVQFSDETVVTNTGHFVDGRPPGLVVIAIIAVLI